MATEQNESAELNTILAELHNATIQSVQVCTQIATALNSINNTLVAISRHVETLTKQ